MFINHMLKEANGWRIGEGWWHSLRSFVQQHTYIKLWRYLKFQRFTSFHLFAMIGKHESHFDSLRVEFLIWGNFVNWALLIFQKFIRFLPWIYFFLLLLSPFLDRRHSSIIDELWRSTSTFYEHGLRCVRLVWYLLN